MLKNYNPDLCLVAGDVNSTMACAIVAQKMHIKVAHIEAGIRSGDWTMPEEINRIVTDSITNYFFTTGAQADENLIKLGVSGKNIFRVGNTMIDSLLKHRKRFIKPAIWDEIGLRKNKFIVITLHRPANVDEESILAELISELIEHSRDLPLIFPVHPRTAKILKDLSIKHPRLFLIDIIVTGKQIGRAHV